MRLALRGDRRGLQGVTQIGEVALWVAFILALFGMAAGYAGGRRGRGDWVLSAERAVYAVFGLLIVVATSKCTIARSLSVNEILADSRRPSPLGEIVVTRVLSPWNGWKPRL